MTDHKIRTTRVTVTPDTLFDERAFEVEIVDEAAGEFVLVRSLADTNLVRIDREDWPTLRQAIDQMFDEIRKNEEGEPTASGEAPLGAETSEASGWIPWSGGECPVDPQTKVRVHLREDGPHEEPLFAQEWDWKWDSKYPDGDITAYKVVK